MLLFLFLVKWLNIFMQVVMISRLYYVDDEPLHVCVILASRQTFNRFDVKHALYLRRVTNDDGQLEEISLSCFER